MFFRLLKYLKIRPESTQFVKHQRVTYWPYPRILDSKVDQYLRVSYWQWQTLAYPEKNLRGLQHSSLVSRGMRDERKSFMTLTPGANVVKLFTAVIYEFS